MGLPSLFLRYFASHPTERILHFVQAIQLQLTGGRRLQLRISTWDEFIGYIGSISLKFRDLRRIGEDEVSLTTSIEITVTRGIGCAEEEEKLRKLGEKKMMKRLSTVQDLADGSMALADIRDGKGRLSGPLLVSSAGLLSAIISTHKNWVAC